jgi:Acetyltransferase (GNAT) domain
VSVLTPDSLLGFYGEAGFKTHRSASGCWYEAGPRFLLAVPTHLPLEIDAHESREILRASGCLGFRYVARDAARGRESWQMSATGATYSLEDFSGNTRSKIRRGLKQHEIRRVSGAELALHGERAFLDTVERQGRAGRYGLERWHRLLAAADRTPGIEIWSAWSDGTLNAYLLIMVFADVCELYEARSRNDALRAYPNNALIYSVTEELLVRRGLSEVTFGVEGLEELDTLDQFKLAMGFVRKPIRQHVVFAPLLRTALALRPLRSVVGALAHRPNSSSFWRRANSLVGFAGFGV